MSDSVSTVSLFIKAVKLKVRQPGRDIDPHRDELKEIQGMEKSVIPETST